jgi:hypothetical protein
LSEKQIEALSVGRALQINRTWCSPNNHITRRAATLFNFSLGGSDIWHSTGSTPDEAKIQLLYQLNRICVCAIFA